MFRKWINQHHTLDGYVESSDARAVRIALGDCTMRFCSANDLADLLTMMKAEGMDAVEMREWCNEHKGIHALSRVYSDQTEYRFERAFEFLGIT